MGVFSTQMRQVAVDLTASLGNPCVLTKVTKGQYNTSLGKSPQSLEDFPTFSAPVKQVSQDFGGAGINTNMSGFDDNKVIVPWIGQEIDKTWLYNGQNIVSVAPTDSQGDIIIYTIEVGEK